MLVHKCITQLCTWKTTVNSSAIITSLAKGGYVFGSVGLSVCLFVCLFVSSKSYEWIGMKFCGGSSVVQ